MLNYTLYYSGRLKRILIWREKIRGYLFYWPQAHNAHLELEANKTDTLEFFPSKLVYVLTVLSNIMYNLALPHLSPPPMVRSDERRVWKECSSRSSPCH